MKIIRGHHELYVQFKVLGTVFSAIAYGIVSILCGNCVYLLQRKRGTHSNRVRISLLIYTTVMLLLSTLTLFQLICQTIAFVFPPEFLSIGRLVDLPTILPFTLWGENVFMVRIIVPHVALAGTTSLQCFRFGVVSSHIRTYPMVPGF